MNTDRELWARAVDGDREAFGLIFDRHSQAVYNHLFRRTADWAEAEDLASAVFLHAWRRREEIVLDRDSALPWLLGVANRSLSNTRRRIRRAEALFPPARGPRRAGAGPCGRGGGARRRRAADVGGAARCGAVAEARA
jgi:DNA-directed RNA polymerase specialized sigma24 family protein